MFCTSGEIHRCCCRFEWCSEFGASYRGAGHTKVLPRDRDQMDGWLRALGWAPRSGAAALGKQDESIAEAHANQHVTLRASIMHFYECDVEWGATGPELTAETNWGPARTHGRCGAAPLPWRPPHGDGGVKFSLRFNPPGARAKRARTSSAPLPAAPAAPAAGVAAGGTGARPELVPPFNIVCDFEQLTLLVDAVGRHGMVCRGRLMVHRHKHYHTLGHVGNMSLTCLECPEQFEFISSSMGSSLHNLLAFAIHTTPAIMEHSMQFLKALQFKIPNSSDLYAFQKTVVRPALRSRAAAQRAQLFAQYRAGKHFNTALVPEASFDVGHLGQPAQHAVGSLMDQSTGKLLLWGTQPDNGPSCQSWEAQICELLPPPVDRLAEVVGREPRGLC